jgi:hypothetical protein
VTSPLDPGDLRLAVYQGSAADGRAARSILGPLAWRPRRRLPGRASGHLRRAHRATPGHRAASAPGGEVLLAGLAARTARQGQRGRGEYLLAGRPHPSRPSPAVTVLRMRRAGPSGCCPRRSGAPGRGTVGRGLVRHCPVGRGPGRHGLAGLRLLVLVSVGVGPPGQPDHRDKRQHQGQHQHRQEGGDAVIDQRRRAHDRHPAGRRPAGRRPAGGDSGGTGRLPARQAARVRTMEFPFGQRRCVDARRAPMC